MSASRTRLRNLHRHCLADDRGLKGKVDEARALFAQFHATVTSGTPAELPEALQEDAERLQPLKGRAYPAGRIRDPAVILRRREAPSRRTHGNTE